MAIKLSSVVPWGRSKQEYEKMFALSFNDLCKKIISFGDGPASFNAEMNAMGIKVISLDPIYSFNPKQIQKRVEATKDELIEQLKYNMHLFIWSMFKDPDDLVNRRLNCMTRFIEDFEKGKKEGRYISHEMPKKTKFSDLQFDIGLSSHFLLLYSNLGLDFHLKSIAEMLRICKEIRIFPILNLAAERSELLSDIISHFEPNFNINLQTVEYEFQKGGNKMLIISNN